MHRDFFFQLAPRMLVLRQLLLGGGDALARRFEPGVERFLALRALGEPASRGVSGRVELLEGDEAFEI